MNSKKNNIHGGGSLTNEVGRTFEEAALNFLLNSLSQFEIEEIELKNKAATERIYSINNKETKVAILGNQNTIFKWLGVKENFDNFKVDFIPSKRLKDVWSKDLRPDIVLLVLHPKPKIHIFEVKYQKGSGSVDEKLQTAIYKKQMWVKLFKQIFDRETDINYSYLLSKWFMKPALKGKNGWSLLYESAFNYLDEEGIEFYINDEDDYFLDQNDLDSKKKPKSKYLMRESKFIDINKKPFNIKNFL